jgi:hypothetical protein
VRRELYEKTLGCEATFGPAMLKMMQRAKLIASSAEATAVESNDNQLSLNSNSKVEVFNDFKKEFPVWVANLRPRATHELQHRLIQIMVKDWEKFNEDEQFLQTYLEVYAGTLQIMTHPQARTLLQDMEDPRHEDKGPGLA